METHCNTERIQVVIIGGGQSGLSVGYCLQQAGLSFAILEANTHVGDSWRRRWDSLRLFTPARFDGPSVGEGSAFHIPCNLATGPMASLSCRMPQTRGRYLPLSFICAAMDASVAFGVENEARAGHELDLAFRELADADLRPLQVRHDRDFTAGRVRDLADELRALDVVLAGAVGEIEPDDVGARGEHPSQHIRLAARGPQRGDDLRGAWHGRASGGSRWGMVREGIRL